MWVRTLTISHPLQNIVRRTLNPVNSLRVELHHLSPRGNRRACEREEGDVDVLLPQVANEVDGFYYAEDM